MNMYVNMVNKCTKSIGLVKKETNSLVVRTVCSLNDQLIRFFPGWNNNVDLTFSLKCGSKVIN